MPHPLTSPDTSVMPSLPCANRPVTDKNSCECHAERSEASALPAFPEETLRSAQGDSRQRVSAAASHLSWRLRQVTGNFLREREGTAAVEFTLLTLFILLPLTIGGLYLWNLVALHNTLSTSAYRAARYVSVESGYIDGAQWESQVNAFVRRVVADELTAQQEKNPWLEGITPQDLTVQVVDFRRPKPQCTGGRDGEGAPDPTQFTFAVQADLKLPIAPLLPILKHDILKDRPLTLHAKRVSYLECDQSRLGP